MDTPTKHQEAAREAMTLLKGTSKGLEAILHDPELAGVRMKVLQHLTKAAGGLQLVAGVFDVKGPLGEKIDNISAGFKPLDSFFGETLDRPLPIRKEELEVSGDEAAVFLHMRDQVFDRFRTMDNDEIAMFLKQPGGEGIIRSVAKKAGVIGYADAELTDAFFDEVKRSIGLQAEMNKTVITAQAQGTSTLGQESKDDDDDEEDVYKDTAEKARQIAAQNRQGEGSENTGNTPPPPPPATTPAPPAGVNELEVKRGIVNEKRAQYEALNATDKAGPGGKAMAKDLKKLEDELKALETSQAK